MPLYLRILLLYMLMQTSLHHLIAFHEIPTTPRDLKMQDHMVHSNTRVYTYGDEEALVIQIIHICTPRQF